MDGSVKGIFGDYVPRMEIAMPEKTLKILR